MGDFKSYTGFCQFVDPTIPSGRFDPRETPVVPPFDPRGTAAVVPLAGSTGQLTLRPVVKPPDLIWDYAFAFINENEALLMAGGRFPRPATLTGRMWRVMKK